MRDEILYLNDIADAANAVEDFLSGVSRQKFLESDLLRSAVSHKIMMMGEAAAHISKDLRVRRSEVDWGRLVGFRAVIVHTYFGIDWEVVWNAATIDVPTLGAQVEHILKEEFPEPEE